MFESTPGSNGIVRWGSDSQVSTWPNVFPPVVVQQYIVSAAISGNTGLVKQLLHRVNVNTRDDLGRTALIGASSQGHVAVVKELLAAGADLQAADHTGHTALMLASRMGHFEAVRWLLAYGANRDARNPHWVNATAYEYALNCPQPNQAYVLQALKYWPQPSGQAWVSWAQRNCFNPVDVKKEEQMLSKFVKIAAKYILNKPQSLKAGPSKAGSGKVVSAATVPVSKSVVRTVTTSARPEKHSAKPKLEDFLNTAPWWGEGVAALKQVLKSLQLPIATSAMQKKSYLGNHADLLAHMKSTGKRKMTTAAVRTWLKNHDTFPVAYKQQGLSLDDCDIDHILPRSVGGIDHPYNYYILPKKLNKRWSGWWTAHKLTYMGAANAKSAKDFFLWVRDEGDRLQIDYNAFDQRRLAA